MSEQKAIAFRDAHGDLYALALVTPEKAEDWEIYTDLDGIAGKSSIIAAVQQDDSLKAQVLAAVLPSAEELAKRVDDQDESDPRSWDQLPAPTRRILIDDAAMFLKALGVKA